MSARWANLPYLGQSVAKASQLSYPVADLYIFQLIQLFLRACTCCSAVHMPGRGVHGLLIELPSLTELHSRVRFAISVAMGFVGRHRPNMVVLQKSDTLDCRVAFVCELMSAVMTASFGLSPGSQQDPGCGSVAAVCEQPWLQSVGFSRESP